MAGHISQRKLGSQRFPILRRRPLWHDEQPLLKSQPQIAVGRPMQSQQKQFGFKVFQGVQHQHLQSWYRIQLFNPYYNKNCINIGHLAICRLNQVLHQSWSKQIDFGLPNRWCWSDVLVIHTSQRIHCNKHELGSVQGLSSPEKESELECIWFWLPIIAKTKPKNKSQ